MNILSGIFMNKTFCIIALFLLLSSCKNSPEDIEAITTKKEPLESAKDVELIYSDSAIIKFILKAPLLHHYILTDDSSYVEFPRGVDVQFYNAKGESDSRLTSEYAIHYEKEDKIRTEKNVEVFNRYGDKLSTEKLWWDKKNRKIYSDVFVKIHTSEEIIYGDGLESNEDFTKYRILNIKGTINVKDESLP